MGTSSPNQLERALAEIEGQFEKGHRSIGLMFERARILAALGRTDVAKQRYLEILHEDATHFGALNNFGTLLYETGFSSAARTVYRQAVACHPDEPLAHVNLANLLFYTDELDDARRHYEIALALNPADDTAHRGLSALFLEIGDQEKMEHHRKAGYGRQPVATLPYCGEKAPIPLLLLVSSRGGEVPWRRLIDDRVFLTTTVTAAFFDQAQELPPHRLVFNAIGDADCCGGDLFAAAALLERTTAPVINPPASVFATGRSANARILGAIPGVITPRIALLPRTALEGPGGVATLAEHGIDFPLLLRRPGFHTGKHFIRVDRPEELTAATATLSGPELLAIEYLNTHGPDGFARKYRVMMIDGKLHPLHLAISKNWKVHYFTAAMTDHAAHQAEEATFLNDMHEVLGAPAMAGLHAIQAALGLDYGGMDFSLDEAGNILLFEANATMLIDPPGTDPQWDYRRAAAENALAAARSLLLSRAGAWRAG